MRVEPLLVRNRRIGPGEPCFVIAEIGTAHGRDSAKAGELIDAAAECGADCAKFQLVYADEIIHPRTGTVRLPGGDIPLYDRFRALEQDEAFYAELKERTERRGLVFLCSPFGIRSARILRRLGVDAMKIASPELNHVPLLTEVSGYGIPLILSSGVSTMEDIGKALLLTGRERSALLHCITAYPAPAEEYNLNVLTVLSSRFGVPVGVSDHSLDPVLVPALAAASGGSIVEKHFTLSRGGEGLDDPIALIPPDFTRMVQAVRTVERLPRPEALAYLEERFGAHIVARVLGNGVKELAPSERANYGRTNRSIHALDDIPPGTRLTAELLAVIRTEKVLRPGLPPEHLSRVLGRTTAVFIPAGEGVRWEDLREK